MRCVIKVDTDNAAFGDAPDVEFCRIIRELADKRDGHPHFSRGHEQSLRDINGNTVGYFAINKS